MADELGASALAGGRKHRADVVVADVVAAVLPGQVARGVPQEDPLPRVRAGAEERLYDLGSEGNGSPEVLTVAYMLRRECNVLPSPLTPPLSECMPYR